MTKLIQKLFRMLKPIKNNQQYEDTLNRIYELMQKNIKPDSKDSDELEILSILVKEYEHEHFPIPKPNRSDKISIGTNEYFRIPTI
jgi:HTH-type transcriptional regulator/antitoxin HigA